MSDQHKDAGLGAWLRLFLGSTVGAVVAAALGFGISAFFSSMKMALITPPEITEPGPAFTFLRAGLNYLAIHHVRLFGTGPNETAVSIAWPVTIWILIPIVSLVIGGFISSKLTRASGMAKFASGAAVAIPYAAILLIARWFFVLPSSAVGLPAIPLENTVIDPSMLTFTMKAVPSSLLYHGLMLGLIFGGIGGLGGIRAIMRAIFSKDAYWPSWARGAMAALILGQLIFFLIVAVATPTMRAKGAKWLTPTLVPEISGLAHYFSHAVTLSGQIKAESAGTTVDSQSYKVGLAKGFVAEGNRKPIKFRAWLIMVIPALALFLGGLLAAKTAADGKSKFITVVGFAGTYALFLSALVTLFELEIKTARRIADFPPTRTTIQLGPSASQAFLFGLVLALIFGVIGVIASRSNASS